MSLPTDMKHYRAPRPLQDFVNEHAPELIIALLTLAVVLDRAGVWT